MAMKKYTQSEGKLEVLRGEEAQVLNDHFEKVGKRKVSDFTEEEVKRLEEALTAIRTRDEDKGTQEG